MENKDIIKALECCIEQGMCDDCSYQHKQFDCCVYLKTDTLKLIKNQQAEIERLSKLKELDNKYIKSIEKAFNDRTAEKQNLEFKIKYLKAEIKKYENGGNNG